MNLTHYEWISVTLAINTTTVVIANTKDVSPILKFHFKIKLNSQ